MDAEWSGAEGERERMGSYVLGLQEIDQTQVAVVGGKGAHLGELSRIEGIRVPAGFCVTTDAFRRIMEDAPSIDDRLDRLSRLNPDDREAIRTLSAEIRRTVEGIVIPDDLAAAITGALARLGERAAYAVRSSATAEDLPAASFAGQQDTYLNVVGAGGDPPARQPVLGLAVHRAGRDLPPAERLRPPEGPHGRGRAADGLPAGGRRPLHGRPRHVQPEGRLRGGQLWPRRGPGLRPGERGRLQGARRRHRRQGGRHQAARHLRLAGRRNAGTADRAGAAGAASADGRAGRAARAAGPADRSALRLPPGHRMVPGRRRLPDRPEPADHHAVSHPGGRRPSQPRLRLRRSSADDDRPHEAAGALPVAADGRPADVRGRREAVRRRHRGAGVASEPRRPPRAPGEVRAADRGRAADHPRTRRLHPVAPGRGSRRAGPWRRASRDRDRSGHRHRADRAQPGFHRRLEARHPDEVRSCAVRLHPGGHPGAETDPVRSAKPSGVHDGDGSHVVAQRAAAGVAGRDERGRHAHTVRPPQRHVGDGAGAPRRRGRDPPASRSRRLSATTSGTRASSTSWPSSRADEKRATRSAPTSTSTACAASARSTSPGPVGANAPPRSCR